VADDASGSGCVMTTLAARISHFLLSHLPASSASCVSSFLFFLVSLPLQIQKSRLYILFVFFCI